ncbi:MAG: muconolactone Delta-isomerase family protein [Bacteroidota bacterium]
MNTVYQFMVDFTLPKQLPVEFREMLPYQKMVVERFFDEGKLRTYAPSFETSKLWAIFNANSEMEVMNMLADLPLTAFMKVSINMLSGYSTAENYLPQFSMN